MTNPFYTMIKRKDLRKKICDLALTYLIDINEKCNEKFCSVLIDGAKRNKKNFYGFVIFTKERLFYFKIEKVFCATSKIIVDIFQEVLDFINTETKFELLAVCTDHATNLFKGGVYSTFFQ